MFKILRLSLCLSLMLLQACQQKATLNTETVVRPSKQHDAAVYNTQLGLAYLKQGDRARAKRKLLAALDLAPKSADTNAAMAYYLEKTGELQEARNFYQKALSLAPNSGAQLNNYGSFLCRQGKFTEAEDYFLKAVKDVRYVNTAGAYENAGLCAAVIPDYTKAEYFFAKALVHDPQRTQSLYELARIGLKQNQATKVLAYIRQYKELALNEPAIVALAVEASHQSGNRETEVFYKMRLDKLNNSTDHTGA